jgi:hypothetical protein
MQPENYFTPELEERMRGINEREMEALLRELEGMPHWIAILKYIQGRLRYVQNTLFYTDPVKEPTEIARTQGIMLGISDFQNAVIMLTKKGSEAENVDGEKNNG